MLPRFNDRKRVTQLVEGMNVQNLTQFFVHDGLCRGFDSQKEDAASVSTDKDEAPKIAIARKQESITRISFLQQRAIRRLGQSNLPRSHHVVSLSY